MNAGSFACERQQSSTRAKIADWSGSRECQRLLTRKDDSLQTSQQSLAFSACAPPPSARFIRELRADAASCCDRINTAPAGGLGALERLAPNDRRQQTCITSQTPRKPATAHLPCCTAAFCQNLTSHSHVYFRSTTPRPHRPLPPSRPAPSSQTSRLDSTPTPCLARTLSPSTSEHALLSSNCHPCPSDPCSLKLPIFKPPFPQTPIVSLARAEPPVAHGRELEMSQTHRSGPGSSIPDISTPRGLAGYA